MKLGYSVSFEYDLLPPKTVKGELEVANVRLGARRAVEAAQGALPSHRGWTSLIVLLQRLEAVESAIEEVA